MNLERFFSPHPDFVKLNLRTGVSQETIFSRGIVLTAGGIGWCLAIIAFMIQVIPVWAMLSDLWVIWACAAILMGFSSYHAHLIFMRAKDKVPGMLIGTVISISIWLFLSLAVERGTLASFIPLAVLGAGIVFGGACWMLSRTQNTMLELARSQDQHAFRQRE